MKTLFSATLIVSLLGGCAAHPIDTPLAMGIVVSSQPPASHCAFLGEVDGSQGGFFEGPFTRDEDLVIGARNILRNKAHDLGADYVLIELEHMSHNTGDGGMGGGYSAIIVGNAYRCANARISTAGNTS